MLLAWRETHGKRTSSKPDAKTGENIFFHMLVAFFDSAEGDKDNKVRSFQGVVKWSLSFLAHRI